jgi:hypothetical protein
VAEKKSPFCINSMVPTCTRSNDMAVQSGEVDAQIEASAERGTAELRQKAPLKPLKKAS